MEARILREVIIDKKEIGKFHDEIKYGPIPQYTPSKDGSAPSESAIEAERILYRHIRVVSNADMQSCINYYVPIPLFEAWKSERENTKRWVDSWKEVSKDRDKYKYAYKRLSFIEKLKFLFKKHD